MKIKLLMAVAAMAAVLGAGAEEASAPQSGKSGRVSVASLGAGVTSTAEYDLSTAAKDGEDAPGGAKEFVDDYANNVQFDTAFGENEATALATIRQEEPLYGTAWAILPPLLAILLALITKEVYSSLFLGIVSGGVLYAWKETGFSDIFQTTITHVMQEGFVSKIANSYNIGIIIFLVLLGALVAMMNKTGASAAFGRWAESHIKTRVGAQLATIVLGVLIFVDDYFNCLTVGSVMRPVTDAKKVSRAKLSYLIDATAAPICIIAPISSWAAAVAGFASGAGAESGFSLFIQAIPYNFYALLTIVMMVFLAVTRFDFGPMKRHETVAASGEPDLGAIKDATEALTQNERGRVIDLIIPVAVLIGSCLVGMIYSGKYFSEQTDDPAAVVRNLEAQAHPMTVVEIPDVFVDQEKSVVTYDVVLTPFTKGVGGDPAADGVKPERRTMTFEELRRKSDWRTIGVKKAMKDGAEELSFAYTSNFVKAFSDSDASVGLVLGSIVAIVFAVLFYLCRRVISFRDCMDGFPEGFKAMVPAIMILCCAWTLKGMTDALGAKIFISDIINGPAAGLQNFLPAIIFVIAIILAFSTGTSWGTFGILIPIVLAAIPGSSMTIIAVSACMAGAVCGDHCSPISDTTIMASAGAQCNHVIHVNTQLPYALLVAAVSCVAYIIAPFIGSVWISLPIAVILMLATHFFMRLIMHGAVATSSLPAVFHKFAQSVNDEALGIAMRRMGKAILADGRIDAAEAEQLAEFMKGVQGQAAFKKALDTARADGIITLAESANLEEFIHRLMTK